MSQAFTVKVDLGPANQSLAAMETAAKQLSPAWASLRRPMRDDQTDHAKKQAGPDGKWPKRSAKTEERARQFKRGGRKKMKAAKTKAKFTNKTKRQFRAGRLMGSLPNRTVKVQQLGKDGLMAASRVPWSGVHQDGGRVGRGSRVPARRFLWLSDGFKAKVTETIERHLVEAFDAP